MMTIRVFFTLIIATCAVAATDGEACSLGMSAVLPSGIRSQETTYWVSPSGQAAWDSCKGATPLNGASACALSTANANAQAGDTVYLREGSYSGDEIRPRHSGTSDDHRIVFRSHGQENVTIRDSAYGIYLYKKSYIAVHGISFYSLRRFVRIYGGHRNTISHCRFDTRSPVSGDWVGALIADDFNDDTPDSENSTHNWVHHCEFYRWVYGAFDEHRGALLDIGSSRSPGPVDESDHNLIEDNVFAYGGHHTLGVYSKYNVIRNNYFHNETNPDNWDFEGYRAVLTEGPSAGHSLYEGNRYGPAGASGMALRSPSNIFRFNAFYHNGSGAIQVVSNQAGVDHADDNRIVHNTFYRNGHLATYRGFQGGMYFANWSGQSPIGNVVKNNIFYDNRNGSVTYDGRVEPQVVEHNWDLDDVDPGFVDLSFAGPDDPSLPDLHLEADSPAIDAGVWLTTITSPSGSGTTFAVEDSAYFMDGWEIVEGDLVQLENGARARISSIDEQTNTITVDTVLSWTRRMGVSLAFEGLAPDLGAHEAFPGLNLSGRAARRSILLDWTVNVALPPTTTWTISYDGPAGNEPSPITGIGEAVRTYTLTGLTGGEWYEVTLSSDPPGLTDTVRAMPTGASVLLPLAKR